MVDTEDGRIYYTIEYEEKSDLEEMSFTREDDALRFVEKLRALDDPAHRPESLVKHEIVRHEKITRVALTVQPNVAALQERVKKRFVEQSRAGNLVPGGPDGLDWVVKATVEALEEGK